MPSGKPPSSTYPHPNLPELQVQILCVPLKNPFSVLCKICCLKKISASVQVCHLWCGDSQRQPCGAGRVGVQGRLLHLQSERSMLGITWAPNVPPGGSVLRVPAGLGRVLREEEETCCKDVRDVAPPYCHQFWLHSLHPSLQSHV